MARHQVRDLARVEALADSSRAHVEQAAELAGEVLGSGQQARRLDRGGRLVGEDREQPQVVVVELVEAQLGERDDADGGLVVAHRDDEHGLVDLVGARDGLPARVVVRVVG